jgi:hypothetical protein
MNSSDDRTSPDHRRFFFREILPFALAVTAGFICYTLFLRRGMWLSVIGYSVAPAERVLDGEAPYRDFLYNYTPGILWLNALLMKYFGASMITINGGLFVFKMATLVALFFTARRLISPWAALVVVALALGWIGYQYVFGVYPTQYSLLFGLLGLLCMLRYDDTERARWLLLCGVAVGAVFVFKYNVGILLIATVTLAIAIRESLAVDGQKWPERLLRAAKKAVFYWAGFALVFGAMASYLASTGALAAMIDHFLHHARAYSEERSIPLPAPKYMLPWVSILTVAGLGAIVALRKAPKLFEAYLIASLAVLTMALLIPNRAIIIKNSAAATVAYLPIFLFVITAVAAVVEFRASRRRGIEAAKWWQSAGAMVIVALFALGIYLEVYPRADYYHLVRVLPPVFLLLLMLLSRAMRIIEPHLQTGLRSPRRALLLTAAVPLMLLLVIGFRETWQPQFDSAFRFRDDTPLETERARGMFALRQDAEVIEVLARIIKENSAEDDYIFSFSQRGTGLYFLADRRNPTRFVWWRAVGISSEDRESALRMIIERKARLIILQDYLKDERIHETVKENYSRIGEIDELAVYSRKEINDVQKP